MLKLLELHPVRGETKEITLPGPAYIANKLTIAKHNEVLERSGKRIMYLNSNYYINVYLQKFEKAGYIHIRQAFEKLENLGLVAVTEVGFWDACIRMGREGIDEKIEIQEDFKDFSEQN